MNKLCASGVNYPDQSGNEAGVVAKSLPGRTNAKPSSVGADRWPAMDSDFFERNTFIENRVGNDFYAMAALRQCFG